MKYIKTYENFISETANQARGMESSIMPFTSYNNIAARLFPSEKDGQDFVKHTHNMAVDYVSKISKEYLGKDKRKKRRKIL